MKQSGPYSESLSRQKMTMIKSLHQKKFRDHHGLFVAEGEKIVREYLDAARGKQCKIRFLCATPDWLDNNPDVIDRLPAPVLRTEPADLKKISSQVSPQEVLAVIEKKADNFHASCLDGQLTLAFSSIRDPGNLGTIIRTADWFGIRNIICSEDSVDLYNPKVIQSAMGSTLRVDLHYMALPEFFAQAKSAHVPVFGTFMEGTSLYDISFPDTCIILFGNESSGIDKSLIGKLDKTISVPNFPPGAPTAESLNIAASMAAITAEIRRRTIQEG